MTLLRRSPAADTTSAEPADAGRTPWGPSRLAAVVVLPFFLLMLAWAFSNPPGSAPDEPDQLVKALGAGGFDFGSDFHAHLHSGARPVAVRNASISRVVSIPAELNPAGYKCTAFTDTKLPTCLPKHRPHGSGDVRAVTDVGSYPPFLYVPVGLITRLATTPTGAFLVARVTCLVLASLLLWLGTAHLIRWLGRRALLGVFVALTPMVVFSSAVVGTSGFEICGAFGVAAVAVVAAFRPESVFEGRTMLVLGVCGVALILSRQLGSVTFTAAVLFMIARIGLPTFWQLVTRHSWPFVTAAVSLAASLGAILWWEPNYDNPALTGPPFSRGAVVGFDNHTYWLVREGVGQFGWLETKPPRWVVFAWVVLAVALVGIAIMFGRAVDRWSLVVWMVALVAVAYVTYATVFYPIRAGVQGRHLLPFFMLVPLLAGAVVAESVGRVAPAVVRRLFLLAAVVMPLIQLADLYFNARRFAVGAQRSWVFLGKSRWTPGLGWAPWLSLGVLAAVLLAVVVVRTAPRPIEERTRTDVER